MAHAVSRARRASTAAALTALLLCLIVPGAGATTLMTEDSAIFGDQAGSALADRGYVAADYIGASMARFHRGHEPLMLSGGSWVPNGNAYAIYKSRVDAWLADVEARGITPYLTLTYQPGFWKTPTTGTEQTALVNGFGTFCGNVAADYNGRIANFGVWNEPNNSHGGRGYRVGAEGSPQPPGLESNPQLYNTLYRRCYTAIKAVNPAMKVNYGELDAHKEGACSYVTNSLWHTTLADGIAIHTYQWTTAPETPFGTTCQGIGRLGEWNNHKQVWANVSKLNKPGGGVPSLHITEHGYCHGDGECPAKEGGVANRIYDENVRADFTRRSFLWARAHGVETFSYYHLFHQSPGPLVWDTGIVALDGLWRPAVYALHDAVVGPGPSNAALAAPGRQVYYRDPSTSAIHVRYWNDNTQSWAVANLGGSAAGEPTAYTAGGNTFVYFRGTNGSIWQLQWSNNAWHLTNLGGNAVGDPTAYRHPSGASHAVYYRGANGSIWQLQWQADNQSWNLTHIGNWAAGDPTAYMSGTSHALYYRGTDGAIWQLQWQADNQSWNMTWLGGAAAGNPTAYASGSSQVVYFRGTNGAIWQLQWQRDNQSWNLTELGGSAAGDPAAYVADGNHFVYFRGTDGKIWQLQWQLDNQSWNLTQLGGSAATDPAAYYASGEHNVFFRGTNGGMWRHVWNATQGWTLHGV